jgi:hypothetical protein
MLTFFLIIALLVGLLLIIPSQILGGAIMLGLLVWMISEGMILWILGSICALVLIGTISNN